MVVPLDLLRAINRAVRRALRRKSLRPEGRARLEALLAEIQNTEVSD